MNGIGPELPLSRDQKFGAYSLIESYKEQIKQNFKNLLLTSPGERIMNPDFGVGLRSFLFEPRVQLIPQIRQTITAQTNKYLPFIKINAINFNQSLRNPQDHSDSKILSVRIQYEVPSINLNTSIVLQGEDIN